MKHKSAISNRQDRANGILTSYLCARNACLTSQSFVIVTSFPPQIQLFNTGSWRATTWPPSNARSRPRKRCVKLKSACLSLPDIEWVSKSFCVYHSFLLRSIHLLSFSCYSRCFFTFHSKQLQNNKTFFVSKSDIFCDFLIFLELRFKIINWTDSEKRVD